MTDSMTALTQLIQNEVSQPIPEEAMALADALRKKLPSLEAILFYGSGLWNKVEDDTIFDFYLIVNRYRDVYGTVLSSFGSAFPPNVHYMQIEDGSGKTLRCKYAVMRMDQFRAGAHGKTLTPQIWARFAQPSRILHPRTATTKQQLIEALCDSVVTFHRRTLPLINSECSVSTLWETGLRVTYGAELRSEKKSRGKKIITAAPDAFFSRSHMAIPLMGFPVTIESDDKIVSHISSRQQSICRAMVAVKRPLQKATTFIRLTKAIFTFDQAVEYALWKMERQSGVALTATPFQKRYPLIGVWPLLWKAYRRGGFR